MNYAEIKQFDVANGPGVRVSLFVSGCTHHCKDCFNAEAWDFDYGKPFTEQTQEELLKMLEPAYISGLTLLGGEPMEPQNQEALLPFIRRVRERFPKKTIWCFSGYLFDRDIVERMMVESETSRELVPMFDVLVDGEFMTEKRNLMLKFRGSENQRVLDVKASLAAGSAVWCEEYR
ncbi:MAG: anaerobic ribonucleoside-triphosphate reductase activating protein [Clostridiales bacterium]|nr:anaerobic ribonucleoside-triphosphate reductase activating protein [Clostridiales bacterium]